MASFDDDVDAANGSGDEFDNEDEEMEDVNDAGQEDDQDQGQDDDGEDDEDEDNDNDDDDNDDDDDEDRDQADSPSQRPSRRGSGQRIPSGKEGSSKPDGALKSPSPHASTTRSPGSGGPAPFLPPVRSEALHAQSYDIVPTMAAPQGTSINAICATADMKWVFSGGSDGYVRMFNWADTANGRVPLTVAQKHPFVDSVMKAGSLLTYWENEEPQVDKTPQKGEDGEGKWLSPVYSLAVQHQAMWLLSGLESGGINLQTCRHQAGSIITTLREHTSAVSVLNLGQDESSLLSGSWDKTILDWDLNVGKVKRNFRGSSGQVSAIETRPTSEVMIPEIAELESFSGTFSTNNADASQLDGLFTNGNERKGSKGDEEDALGSPSGSLFGDGDHGSLFGEDNGPMGGGNAFGDDDDDLTNALADGLDNGGQDAAGIPAEVETDDLPAGGPVQPPDSAAADTAVGADNPELPNFETETQPQDGAEQQKPDENHSTDIDMESSNHTNGMITAPPTGETQKSDLPTQSESTFLDATIEGMIRIWDRRVPTPVATIVPYGGTPPWCVGACWSPDGNFIYAGRRNCSVDEYSIHKMGTNRNKPERNFRFQAGSGSVYAVRAMPNGRHLVCASHDILRLYDLSASETARHRTGPPFNIVPGHRGGVLSAVYIDPTCRFMLSAAGNRGWESTAGTEVLLGYEIGVQDQAGIWHR